MRTKSAAAEREDELAATTELTNTARRRRNWSDKKRKAEAEGTKATNEYREIEEDDVCAKCQWSRKSKRRWNTW